MRYGADVVIDELSWTVGTQAPVAALLGPSGCGKVHSAAGHRRSGAPGGRAYRLRRTGPGEVPAHRRDFGVVFQDGNCSTDARWPRTSATG